MSYGLSNKLPNGLSDELPNGLSNREPNGQLKIGCQMGYSMSKGRAPNGR